MSDPFWACFDRLLASPAARWIGHEPITLSLPAGTDRVRIAAANPIPLPMHIACVHFFGPQGRMLPQGMQVQASSWWDGSNLSAAEQTEQFLNKPFGSGIHTACEKAPWIELRMRALDKPALMAMFNRTDLWGWRNEWVRVVAHGKGLPQQVVFDAQAEARAWLALLARKAKGRDPCAVIHKRVALDLITALLLGDPALHEQEERVGMLWNPRFDALQDAFQTALDYRLHDALQKINRVAALRRLEVAAHGVARTFRFLSTASKEVLLQRTADVCDLLQTLGFRACAGYGTVLGLVRDGDLIAHDDDLDVHAIVPAPSPGVHVKDHIAWHCQALASALVERGLQVIDKGTHVKVRCEHDFDTFSIDVFPSVEADGDLRSAVNHKAPVGPSGRFAIGHTVHGRVALPMPQDGQAYCQGVYGVDWRTPIARYEHSWV